VDTVATADRMTLRDKIILVWHALAYQGDG